MSVFVCIVVFVAVGCVVVSIAVVGIDVVVFVVVMIVSVCVVIAVWYSDVVMLYTGQCSACINDVHTCCVEFASVMVQLLNAMFLIMVVWVCDCHMIRYT